MNPPTHILEAIRLNLDEDSFNQAALDLFRYQAKYNSVYRKFLQSLSVDAQEIIHWEEIPPLPASSFRSERVACFPPIGKKVLFKTSGTSSENTGTHEFETLEFYEKSMLKWFEAKMPNVARHQWISLIPSFEDRPEASLSYMISTLSRVVSRGPVDFLADANYHFDPSGVLSRILMRAEEGKPIFILGTSFAFARLIEAMGELRLQTILPEGSVLFDTGGFKGHTREITVERYLDMLGEALGIQPGAIYNEYGMTELSSQAYTTMDVQLHVFPPWCKYQIRDPRTGKLCGPGEKGIVEIIDLANVGSVLAISTMDAGIRHNRGLELCGRIDTASLRGCSLQYE